MARVVVLLLAALTAATTAAPSPPPPLPPLRRRELRCLNATHYERRDALTGARTDVSACRFGFACVASSCRAADLPSHLLRAADFQIVESVPASQLDQCTASHAADVANGLMLCDLLHSTREAQPTFGHILGNTWVHFGFGPNATSPACSASPAAWRQCFAANIAAQVSALQAESPELLVSGGLMEFLDSANVDDEGGFPGAYCRPGTVGQWGGNTTCVPDVTKPAAQDYYVQWGRLFLDAGIRAVFFGQARLTGGSRADGSDNVDPAGAEGFLAVISALRAYADQHGYSPVYFGPQAAAGIVLANGTQIADWAYGAQHLEAHGVPTVPAPDQTPTFLTQPLLRNGSYIKAAEDEYGAGDFHDASWWNAGGAAAAVAASSAASPPPLLPTVLDYDNFSGDPGTYDDIRRLAAWPTATRGQLVVNHVRYVRSYNPFAFVTVPFTKWLAVPDEVLCYANTSVAIWGAGSVYFSAYACGLVDAAVALWADPFVPPLNGGVEAAHLGQQLQGSDDTAVFVFAAALGRNFSSTQEYADAVLSLPPRMYAAAGPRCAFVTAVVTSAEFTSSVCSPAALGPLPAAACAVNRTHRAVLLADAPQAVVQEWAPAIANGTATVGEAAEAFCGKADAAGLYGLK